MSPYHKIAYIIFALGLTAVASRADNNSTDIANDLANGKSVTTSGYYNEGSEVFPASNITDEEFNDSGSPFNWSFWLTPQGQLGYATIDLGADYDITQFDLQDTHNRGYYDRGTQDFTISTSLDGTNFSTVYTGAFTDSEWANLTWLDVGITSTDAQYVKFTITSLWGGASGGLNELQVFGSSAAQSAPDGGIGLTLVAGVFGLLLFVGRRNRRSAAI
jgi:hypothetical protein